jgi:hypothetical protein
MVLRFDFAKKIAIAAASVVALSLPILVGVMCTHSISVQSTGRPRFVSATIRPAMHCGDGGRRVTQGGQARGGIQRKSQDDWDEAPGTLRMHCVTLGGDAGLIRQAYVVFATGEPAFQVSSPALSGGPDWLDSETFDLDARAEGEPGGGMTRRGCWIYAVSSAKH